MPEKFAPLDIARLGGRQRSGSPADTEGIRQAVGSGDVLVAQSSWSERSSAGQSSAYEFCGPLGFRWADHSEAGSDVLVLEVAGDIDMETTPDLRTAILKKLATDHTGCTVLVIDLRHVTFMGSHGLALIVDILKLCSRHGMGLHLIATTHVTRKPLEASGLAAELHIFTDRESALSNW